MKLKPLFLAALAFFLPMSTALAEQPEAGPVIENYGPVYSVPDATFKLDPTIHYRSVMDVSDSPKDIDALNRRIESAARFLNMHARSGIPVANLELAVVLHGQAGKDALSDLAYRKRFGSANPNTAMLAALNDAGVKIYLCGQTAAYREFGADELNPAVSLATSAMTALTRLQAEGWSLLP